MLAGHRLYLETEYHQGHRANFASADGGIAQLGRHIALHPAWAQHHRPRISWPSVGLNSEGVRRVSVPDYLASIHSGAA